MNPGVLRRASERVGRPTSDASRSLRPPAKHARASRRAGFSIIELLGVIVVLGLIATLVSINWRAILPKTELHSAVRTLASTLQGTRSEAIARNGYYQVQYDLEKNRYRVVTPFRVGGGLAAGEEDRAALAWNLLPESIHFKGITVDGLEYTKGMVHVRFDPLGTSSSHVVVLEQLPYNNLYTIEVQGLLGLIDYHEGPYTRVPPREGDFR